MTRLSRLGLACEWAVLFIAAPLAVFCRPTLWSVHLTLWAGTLYAVILLFRARDFSWRAAFRGNGWSKSEIARSAIRFALSAAAIFFLTRAIAPARVFSFPLQRPGFYLVVMLLYPLLSALPQEILFRVFFFRRYAPLFGEKALPFLSAFVFGFVHIVFHNWVAPPLAAICGFFIAWDYARHRSLGVATLEHALYGDMVFTMGIGLYFLVHHS